MEKFPSKSVDTPFVVPLTRTVAPGSGPSGLETVPLTVWAYTKLINAVSMNKLSDNKILFFIVFGLFFAFLIYKFLLKKLPKQKLLCHIIKNLSKKARGVNFGKQLKSNF